MSETYSVGDVFEVNGVLCVLHWRQVHEIALLRLDGTNKPYLDQPAHRVWSKAGGHITPDAIHYLTGSAPFHKINGAKVAVQYPQGETSDTPARRDIKSVPWPGPRDIRWIQIRDSVLTQADEQLCQIRLMVESHYTQPTKPKLPVDWYGCIRKLFDWPQWYKLTANRQQFLQQFASAIAKACGAELPGGWNDSVEADKKVDNAND